MLITGAAYLSLAQAVRTGRVFEKDRLASLNLSLFRSVEPVWLVTVSENSSGSVAFLCSHILTFIGFFTS